MQNFDTWFIHLIEDERFYENASRNHRKETVEATARKIYEVATVDRDMFEITSIAEHRKHLLFKLYKIPADKIKKNWHEIALEEKQQEEAKNKKPEEPPLVRGSEQYLKRCQEYLDAIKDAPMMKAIAPLSAKERIEGKEWRVKPESIREPTEMEKITAAKNHYATMRVSRMTTFLEAYPDAEPEEIEAYLDKFHKIDDPLNLFDKDNPHGLPY